MLIGLLYTLFVILCFFIIFVVLLQKSKGSLGLTSSMGNAALLFGGSGGHDVFQKMTWISIALFMSGSLLLAILKNRSVRQSRYITEAIASSAVAAESVQPPVVPATTPETQSSSETAKNPAP